MDLWSPTWPLRFWHGSDSGKLTTFPIYFSLRVWILNIFRLLFFTIRYGDWMRAVVDVGFSTADNNWMNYIAQGRRTRRTSLSILFLSLSLSGYPFNVTAQPFLADWMCMYIAFTIRDWRRLSDGTWLQEKWRFEDCIGAWLLSGTGLAIERLDAQAFDLRVFVRWSLVVGSQACVSC